MSRLSSTAERLLFGSLCRPATDEVTAGDISPKNRPRFERTQSFCARLCVLSWRPILALCPSCRGPTHPRSRSRPARAQPPALAPHRPLDLSCPDRHHVSAPHASEHPAPLHQKAGPGTRLGMGKNRLMPVLNVRLHEGAQPSHPLSRSHAPRALPSCPPARSVPFPTVRRGLAVSKHASLPQPPRHARHTPATRPPRARHPPTTRPPRAYTTAQATMASQSSKAGSSALAAAACPCTSSSWRWWIAQSRFSSPG